MTEAIFYSLNENPCLNIGAFGAETSSQPSSKPYLLLNRIETPNFLTWKENVDKVLKAISSGVLDKLVLARRTTLQFSQPISIRSCLNHLLNKAQRATLFAFQLSPSFCFLGATPEKLFERTGDELTTDVLAGTRPRGATSKEDVQLERDLLSSVKEQREFTIVKEFLQQVVCPLSQKMQWDKQDRVFKASHVQHIHNRLNATLKGGISDAELIDALHPTPALGGYPREKAHALLKQIEPFDRGWYGGPIGVISPKSASLHVAIRSALIRQNSLHLFAGTGIVQGSVPEQEWDELEQKIRPFTELF
jgi:menaquinone-specific isochorismate synthase